MGWHTFGYSHQALIFKIKKPEHMSGFLFWRFKIYFKKPFSAKKAILIFDSVFCSAALSPSNKRSI